MRKFRPTAFLPFVLIGMLGAVLAFAAAGCGGDDDDDDTPPGEEGSGQSEEATDFTLNLPFPDSILWTGYEISRGADGPYEVDYRLRMNTEATEGDSIVTQLISSDKIDYGIAGVPLTLIANARGNEQFGLATIVADVFAIAATPESGVTSLSDLAGKSLGVTDIAGGEMPLVNAALKDAGLEPGEDVQLLPVGGGGGAAEQAIKSGKVAAYAGAAPDFVPLENAGLQFESILPAKFQGLPTTVLVVRPELLEDEEQLAHVIDMQKGWFEGILYGEMYPEDGLDRICKLVPEDCQDAAFAEGFYNAAIEISVDLARNCGRPDYEKLELVRDAIAAEDVPDAANVDVEKVFPDTYNDRMCPDEQVIEEFAKRTGASGGQ